MCLARSPRRQGIRTTPSQAQHGGGTYEAARGACTADDAPWMRRRGASSTPRRLHHQSPPIRQPKAAAGFTSGREYQGTNRSGGQRMELGSTGHDAVTGEDQEPLNFRRSPLGRAPDPPGGPK